MNGAPGGSDRAARRRRSLRFLLDDRGAAGNLEVLPFGLLVFVVGSLLITNAWAVVDARMAVSAAAREATRAYVEAPNGSAGTATAQRAAADTIAGHGRDPSRLKLDIQTAGFARCAPVTIRAGYDVPAMHLPWIGGYGHGFDVWSTHTERIDPYRSGLAGAAQC